MTRRFRGARTALGLLGLLAGTAWMTGACVSESSAPRSESSGAAQSPRLTPLPEPNLEPLEPAVRQAMSDARAELERRLSADLSAAEMSEAYGELAKLYLAHQLLEPAKAVFHHAQALDPFDPRWTSYLGRLYRMQNELIVARRSFERVLSLEPGDVPTLIAVGELLLTEDRPDEAEARFAEALAADPSSAPALVGLGKAASLRGEFAEAVGRFEAALAIQPEASAIHYPLAMAHRELGDLERARFHLARLGERPASQPDPLMDEVRALAAGGRAHLLRAGQALEAGRLDQGLEELRRAVAADPDDATSRVTLGALLAQRGDREEAKQQFAEALRLDPGYAKAHYNLGLTLSGEGDDRRALEHYRRALESDPGHTRARLQLAGALVRIDRAPEALEQYDRLLELEPTHEAARLQQALILARTGAYAEVRDRLEAGLAQLPESQMLAHALARLLAASPDPDVRDGRRALALATEVASGSGLFEGTINFDHGQTLAMSYAELGRFDRAIELQRAILAAAERDRRTERLPWLRENLSRYESGRPCRTPWPEDDPVFGFLVVMPPGR